MQANLQFSENFELDLLIDEHFLYVRMVVILIYFFFWKNQITSSFLAISNVVEFLENFSKSAS